MDVMIIRKFKPEDADQVSALIIKTLREVSIKDYSSEYIENIVLNQKTYREMNYVE